jgi:hypothetical protein
MSKLNLVARRVALGASLALVAALATTVPLKIAAAETYWDNGQSHSGQWSNGNYGYGQHNDNDWRGRRYGNNGGYGYGGGGYYSYPGPSYYYAPRPTYYYQPAPTYYAPAPYYGSPSFSFGVVIPGSSYR